MPSPFVCTDGTRFSLDQRPFSVHGVNCYFLAYCSEQSRRAAMWSAKRMGASVIRSWAFLAIDDFSPGRVAFQYPQNNRLVVNDGPDGLHRLDKLIATAEEIDIKLILPLLNHWNDLGGMPAYVKWFSPGSDVTEFYRAPLLRSLYRNWVHQILTRRNTITGRLYSDEPSILAWELTNEARCQTPGGRDLLLEWTNEMATFVKQRDTNHLLALGDEGFFYQKGRGHLYDGAYGVDWEAILAVDQIDFGTYHFYPQSWGFANDLSFAERWISDHAAAASKANKPAILEEFGLKLDADRVRTAMDRDYWFGQWMTAIRRTGTAGALLWMLGQKSPDTAGYVDDYVVYEVNEIPAIADATSSMAGG
jgi:mannan endo-1,4-beta-mannosidase